MSPTALADALSGCDAILHFAGINRGNDAEIEAANPAIARALVSACGQAGIAPCIVHANSIHSTRDTAYGRSKLGASQILGEFAGSAYTDLILPHVFGECARPFYNNVTATLIAQLWRGETPIINPEGQVELLHAGEVARLAIAAAQNGGGGRIVPEGRKMRIEELHRKLQGFDELYQANIFPETDDSFDLSLFNTYRTGGYPAQVPFRLNINRDQRGDLFESAKGGGSAHCFMSTTYPGKIRGDHFHTDLIERFLVVQGDAVIRIRRVLTDEIQTFVVSGNTPVAVDMPPLHTHHIENIGADTLITFFWAHRIFDPAGPDTFSDPVIGAR